MITSLDNKKVKEWTKLHQKKYRKEEYLLMTAEAIEAAREHGYLRTLIYTGEPPFEYPVSYEVSKEVMEKITAGRNVPYCATASLIKESEDWGKLVFLLDHLQDPLNIGRIMETALLFGFDSIILSEECADITHEKVLEESRGALYHLHISTGDLREKIFSLKEKGFRVYATGLRGETKELHEVTESERMAFVLGNEGSGVSEEIMDIADEIVKIDMDNIDSLNVAMAGSIVAYRFRLL